MLLGELLSRREIAGEPGPAGVARCQWPV